MSLLAKNKSTAVKNAPFTSSFEEFGEGASILPATTKVCANGSTNGCSTVSVCVFIVVVEAVVFVVKLVTVCVVRFLVVVVTVFSHCSRVPSEL